MTSSPASSRFFAGTSNLVLPMPKKSFPPGFEQHSRLAYYATQFNSLEVNSSFYKVPRYATFARWGAEVPDGFRFSIKFWKQVTHSKGLQFNPADVDHFLASTAGLPDHQKGCLLLQFPKSIDRSFLRQLTSLLKCIRQHPASQPWRLSVEFRHPGWYTPHLYAQLERWKAAVVLHDMPASAMREPPVDRPWVYCRFHGETGDYRGDYSKTRLAAYARRMKKWLDEGREVYAYFNNTLGNAYHNGQMLRVLVKGGRVRRTGSSVD